MCVCLTIDLAFILSFQALYYTSVRLQTSLSQLIDIVNHVKVILHTHRSCHVTNTQVM